MTQPKRRRRWFTLSLRGTMVLILVVGGLMGWKARRASLQRRGVANVVQLGGAVVYDWQYGGHAYLVGPATSPSGPVWLRRILGDAYFQEVVQVNLPGELQFGPILGDEPDALEKWSEARKAFEEKYVKPIEDDQLACLEPFDRLGTLLIQGTFPLKDQGLTRLGGLSHLKELHVGDNFEGDDLGRLGSLTNLEILSFQIQTGHKTDVRFLEKLKKLRMLHLGGIWAEDEHLASVGRLPVLESLSIVGFELTDSGLAHLKTLKTLKVLSIIEGRNLTGEAMIHLEGLTKLETVFLTGAPMNNIGLRHLQKLPNLTMLSIPRGQLDDATIDEFKAARPGVTLTISP